jgi:hypothetical protein
VSRGALSLRSGRRRSEGSFRELLKDIEAYRKILQDAVITWMDDQEIGMAPVAGRRRPKYPVLLWPYKYDDPDEMARVMTHEIVHYAHPDLTDSSNESAVDAKTTALMANPVWQLLVYYKLLYAMHRSVKREFARNKAFTIA